MSKSASAEISERTRPNEGAPPRLQVENLRRETLKCKRLCLILNKDK